MAAADPAHLAHSLFVTTGLLDDSALTAITINTTSGATLAKVKTDGGYNCWGESTRMFEFDPGRNKFYMLDVDFTKPAPKGGRPITLFAIDPVSGKTTATPVTGGPVGYVHGYVMHEESGNVHFSTAGEGVWNFWLVDPDTGKATRVG